MASTWEELGFWLDVLRAAQGTRTKVRWVYEKIMYVSIK
jgi:hypothetical protein